mgnify:CR=1 FL=1
MSDDPGVHLKAAFTALLRGDLAERDRQCDLAKAAMDRQQRRRDAAAREILKAAPIPLVEGPDGVYRPDAAKAN